MKFFAGRVLLALSCATALLLPASSRGEAMLQYFNTSWNEIALKMPELAEAGYDSLWLPPPTKGSGGLSVGYDLFDRFDLGSKDQRGSIRTRYGTEADLLRMIEIAHRFGIRVYFDNVMNHNAFDVPGYDANTPIDIYPGLVPEDFHLRLTQEGFYRKWDNISNWNDTWQVQHRNFLRSDRPRPGTGHDQPEFRLHRGLDVSEDQVRPPTEQSRVLLLPAERDVRRIRAEQWHHCPDAGRQPRISTANTSRIS